MFTTVVSLAAASAVFGCVGSKDAPKEMIALARAHAIKTAIETFAAKNKGELPSGIADIVKLLPEGEKGLKGPWDDQTFQFMLSVEGGESRFRLWVLKPSDGAQLEYGVEFPVPVATK